MNSIFSLSEFSPSSSISEKTAIIRGPGDFWKRWSFATLHWMMECTLVAVLFLFFFNFFPLSFLFFFSSPGSISINLHSHFSFPGSFSWSHHIHTVRPLHRPVSCCHQRADVLWDDRKLHLDDGQAGCHLGGRTAAGPARDCAAPAGKRGPRIQRQPTGRAVCGEDIHRTAWHHLRVSSHLRWGKTLVVLWLLFLSAHPFHYYLLPGNSKENQEGRKGLHKGEQTTNSAGKSDELHSGGFDHFIWILHHSWKHLQHCDCLHIHRGLSADYGPPPSH